jgi:murein peptide amidase A
MLAVMESAFHWREYLPAFASAAFANGFSREVLADTAAGPLVAWRRAGGGRRVYLSSGIHGDEPAGPLALLELMRSGFLTPDVEWAICPALNPTGLAAGTRNNAEGADLNRDYHLLQSIETSAHAAWLAAGAVPDLSISLHEDWESSGFYLYEINLGVDRPERALEIIAAASPWFAPEAGPDIDGHTPREAGWIYHEAEADVPEGWPEAIYVAKLGCPLSFTLETPSHARLADRVGAHCAAVRAACMITC